MIFHRKLIIFFHNFSVRSDKAVHECRRLLASVFEDKDFHPFLPVGNHFYEKESVKLEVTRIIFAS